MVAVAIQKDLIAGVGNVYLTTVFDEGDKDSKKSKGIATWCILRFVLQAGSHMHAQDDRNIR